MGRSVKEVGDLTVRQEVSMDSREPLWMRDMIYIPERNRNPVSEGQWLSRGVG